MRFVHYLVICSLVASCSDDKEDQESTSSPTIATVTVTGESDKSDDGSIIFNQADCNYDNTTGSGTVSLTTSDSNSSLTIKFKGLKSSAKDFECQQPVDNQSKGSVGGSFDDCGVIIRRAKINSSTGAQASNTYATYRSDNDMGSFSYTESCNISVTSAEATNIVGSISSCAGLVQTHYEDSYRNPIEGGPKVQITGTFKCK